MHTPLPKLNPRYGLSAFLAGAVVLFIELAGTRLLAAVFGSSLYVWSALITVTLLSLAAGAWWGGWFADQWESPKVLSLLWFCSALTMGMVVPLRGLIFPLADQVDLRIGVLLCSLLLFFMPLAFLAAVPPVLIKLMNPDHRHLGRVVGKISALGTAGSCFGAIATGFYLVPSFPLTKLFLYLSLLLFLAGIISSWKTGNKLTKVLLLFSWIGCLLLFSPERNLSLIGNRATSADLEINQSLYGQLQVMEEESKRLLFLDGIFQGGMKYPSGVSLTQYTATMEILGLSAVPNPGNILVIGLGSGVIPSDFHKKGLNVEAVEINPQVVDLCRNWFDLPLPIEKIHRMDGRQYLKGSREAFDLIFLDAFAGEEMPANLLTLEAFQSARNHLSDQGALLLNYVGFSQPPSSRVLSTITATLKKVFPSVGIFRAGDKESIANFIVVARVKEGPWSPTPDIPWGNNETASLSKILGNLVQPDEPYPFLIRDDYSPLEWLDRKTRFAWREKCVGLMQLAQTGL